MRDRVAATGAVPATGGTDGERSPASLRALVNAWDPIGVFDEDDPDRPEDEYDCLTLPLFARLRRGDTPEELVRFLRRELEDHFGLDPGRQADRIVTEVVRWRERPGTR